MDEEVREMLARLKFFEVELKMILARNSSNMETNGLESWAVVKLLTAEKVNKEAM